MYNLYIMDPLFFDALSIIIGLQTMNVEYNIDINEYLKIFKCIFITFHVIGVFTIFILSTFLTFFMLGFSDNYNYSLVIYLIIACAFTTFSRDISLQLIHYFNRINRIAQIPT